MRAASADSIKRNKQLKNYPKEGSNLSRIYNLFNDHKGELVEFTVYKTHDREAVNQLIDYYGLDIRNVSRKKWVLAGEWFGKIYIDYIADKIKE